MGEYMEFYPPSYWHLPSKSNTEARVASMTSITSFVAPLRRDACLPEAGRRETPLSTKNHDWPQISLFCCSLNGRGHVKHTKQGTRLRSWQKRGNMIGQTSGDGGESLMHAIVCCRPAWRACPADIAELSVLRHVTPALLSRYECRTGENA